MSPVDGKRILGIGRRCFSISVVPTGLILILMHNPGTEVPGYFPGVPTGRKMANLKIHHCIQGTGYLTRISHQVSTAAADPSMSTALRSVVLLDVLSSMPAEPSVARLVSMPVCDASLRNLVRNAG